MKSLRITLSASQDLDEISDYFLGQSIDADERFVEAFNLKSVQLDCYLSATIPKRRGSDGLLFKAGKCSAPRRTFPLKSSRLEAEAHESKRI